MRKRLKLFIFSGFLALLLLAVSAAILDAFHREPSYQGKRLSAWIDDLRDLSRSNYLQEYDTNTQPARAIRAIGSNAIPWLLNDIQHPGLPWRFRANVLLEKQHLVNFRFHDAYYNLQQAMYGFCALGEQAKPAIPDLLKLVSKSPAYVPVMLANIGPDAIPALQQCLTNTYSEQVFDTSTRTYVRNCPIPGQTIFAIHNAINFGRIPKSYALLFVPAVRAWSVSTNRSSVELDYAGTFLASFDPRFNR